MSFWGLLFYFREHFTALPEVSTFRRALHGKTLIVTGANTGVGLETARHLARMDPKKLILACRDLEKAQIAIEGE